MGDEEGKKDVLVHAGDWGGKKDGLVVYKKNVNVYILSLSL